MLEAISGPLVEYVISIVVIVIGAAVSYVAPKIKRWIKKKSDSDDLGIIDAITDRTVEFVENEFLGEEGEVKFEEATEQVAHMLQKYGIDASDDLIRRSVQKGWRLMDEKQKNEEEIEDVDEGFLDDMADEIEEDVEGSDEEPVEDEGEEEDE